MKYEHDTGCTIEVLLLWPPITVGMHAQFSAKTPRGVIANARRYVLAHKMMSIILIAALGGGSYWTYQKLKPSSSQTRYTLGTVATGTIISTVSATGQVSASNSIDIKPQVSGTITKVLVSAGNKVGAGQALATVDNTTALQTLNASKKALAAGQLQFQKDSAQAPINYQTDQNTLATAKETLATDYNTIYNDLTGTYLDLPSIMSTAENAISGYDFDSRKLQNNIDALLGLFTTQDTSSVKAFQKAAQSDYASARISYDASLATYQTTSRTSSTDAIENLLLKTADTVTQAAQTLQTELNFFNVVSSLAQTYNITLPTKFSTVQSDTRSQLATTNTHLSTLLADKKTLDTGKQAITDAQNALKLDLVGNSDGSNPISLQISKNNIEKQQQDIANQEADLAKYIIRAPFAGTISSVSAKVGDSAGSAAVATIISSSQIATLSVNEIDAAKIKLRDKATLTFDAISGLTLTGVVAEIDPVGTVSQGVVSYTIKIAFDTQDARVKPGMTANASIQTDVHQNVLIVPSSALKTQNGSSYVQVFNPPLPETGGTSGITSSIAPQNVTVTTGISDDANTEIVSGLFSGEQIVARTTTGTIAPSSTGTTRTGTTNLRGGGGFGGPGIRLD